ncbi:hypothetical protein NUW58_g5627 [Xylaria curta]|uniref:Uncharacterized protein n=1 Tax=Xylaria curta TaxID=42375 RepID=A0ACC1P1Y8_9PEZI|nr:hypothetical protein NUW58_g5627 [Xylaria curta]
MQTNPSLENTSATPTNGTNKRPRPPSSTSISVAPKRTKPKAVSSEVDSEKETDNLLQSLQRPLVTQQEQEQEQQQSYPNVAPAPEPLAETPVTQVVESDRENTPQSILPTPQSILPTPNPFEVLANLEKKKNLGSNNENEQDDSSSFDTVLENAPKVATQPSTPQQKPEQEPESPVPQPLWPVEQTLNTIDQLCSPDQQQHQRDLSETRFPIRTTSSTPSRFQTNNTIGNSHNKESLELILYNPQGYDVVMANTPKIKHLKVTVSNPLA